MDQCDTMIDLIKYMSVIYSYGPVILPYILKVNAADLVIVLIY